MGEDVVDARSMNTEGTDASLQKRQNLQPKKYRSSTGVDYFLLPKPEIVKRIKDDEKYLSPSLCDNCQRYLFLFCNRPCVVPCGHTFCEMCLVTEEVKCIPCNKSYNPKKPDYIINASLIDMYNNFPESFVVESSIDSLLRTIRKEVSSMTMAIHAYLPIWTKQLAKGRRLQITLGFFSEEQNMIQKKQKFVEKPWIEVDKCIKLAKLKVDLEKVINYQNEEWSNVIKEHKDGLNSIPKTLCTKGLNLETVLEEFKNLYFATYFHGERFYLKLSKGYGIVHLHSGFWSSAAPEDFVRKNKICELSFKLNKITEVFMDVCFYVPTEVDGAETITTEENRRIYISLPKDKDNYAERMLSLFIGQFKTLKGTKIFIKKNAISIPEPVGMPSIFSVPSTHLQVPSTNLQERNKKKLEGSAVIGHAEGETFRLEVLLASKESSLYKSLFAFGKLHSGFQFLKVEGARAKGGIIKDCGLVFSSESI